MDNLVKLKDGRIGILEITERPFVHNGLYYLSLSKVVLEDGTIVMTMADELEKVEVKKVAKPRKSKKKHK